MRTVVVVQSRLSSRRLPGKALLTLAGLPMAVLVARRAANHGADVVVATSIDPTDDVLAGALEDAGVRTYRGPLDDTLARFAGAVEGYADEDVVVRLTADNVVPDGAFVADLVDGLGRTGAAYVRVADGLPYGLGAEAFTVGLLRRAHRSATTAYDREHVTPWMRRQTGDHEHPVPCPHDAALRCTVDGLDDFVIASRALATVAEPLTASWRTLLDAWAAHGGRDVHLPTTGNPLHQGPWVLGTAQLGMDYGIGNRLGAPDAATARAIVGAAVAAGATHLDTARAYGDGEAVLGRTLSSGLAERVRVVTKTRPLALPDDAPAGWVGDALHRSLQESLRALRADAVDVVLVHRWHDWVRAEGAGAAALTEAVQAGLARAAGASVGSPEEAVAALGDGRVRYLQIPVNVLDRRWLAPEVAAAFAARPDVVVTARSVFLQGLLTTADEDSWPGNAGVDPAEVRRALATVATELGREGTADLAVAYVRSLDFVDSVVLGAESVDQVRDQARVLARPPLTADEAAQVRDAVPAGPVQLVDPSRWERS